MIRIQKTCLYYTNTYDKCWSILTFKSRLEIYLVFRTLYELLVKFDPYLFWSLSIFLVIPMIEVEIYSTVWPSLMKIVYAKFDYYLPSSKRVSRLYFVFASYNTHSIFVILTLNFNLFNTKDSISFYCTIVRLKWYNMHTRII